MAFHLQGQIGQKLNWFVRDINIVITRGYSETAYTSASGLGNLVPRALSPLTPGVSMLERRATPTPGLSR